MQIRHQRGDLMDPPDQAIVMNRILLITICEGHVTLLISLIQRKLRFTRTTRYLDGISCKQHARAGTERDREQWNKCWLMLLCSWQSSAMPANCYHSIPSLQLFHFLCWGILPLMRNSPRLKLSIHWNCTLPHELQFEGPGIFILSPWRRTVCSIYVI